MNERLNSNQAIAIIPKRMLALLKVLQGEDSASLGRLLQLEPRGSEIRQAYQKIDYAIVEAIIEESKALAAALQKQRQAL